MSFLQDLVRLLYPARCCGCGELLVGDEHDLCSMCLLSLPLTQFSTMEGNRAERLFRGRLPLQAATSLLYFNEFNTTRALLHEIKYHDNIKLAHTLGAMLGQEMTQSHRFDTVDCIVPIPLHWRKKIQRGYNQSLEICEGIAKTFPRPILKHNMYRKHYTETQTRKNRLERMQNTEGVFSLRNPQALYGKHILVVDDVITTGATIESACRLLADLPTVKISVASIALATTT